MTSFVQKERRMLRVRLIIPRLQLAFIFQACAALEYFDGSSREEMKRLKIGKNEVWNELDKLKIENADLQKKINILRKENQEIRAKSENKIARMTDEAKLLHSHDEQVKRRESKNYRGKPACVSIHGLFDMASNCCTHKRLTKRI
jgi:hypothetical protein